MTRRDEFECYEETTKEDLVRGFSGFFDSVAAAMQRIAAAASKPAQERARVRALLNTDAAEREQESRRRSAVIELDEGKFVNIEDTVLPPTPEWMEKADVVAYTPKGEDGTVRSIRTVRRLLISQLTYLHSHGVLDDDLYSACRWYKDRYEAAQMEPAAGIASYGETVRGDPCYGHLPRSRWAAEARTDYRWAQTFIPLDVRDLFEMVILQDQTLTDASRLARRGFRNVRASLLRAALELHGGIAHRLEIDKKFD
jgi:hypothetical protein